MGVRRTILEKLFKVKNMNAAFSDARHAYYASATAVAVTPKRKGQLIIGNSGATFKIYIAKAATGTGTSAWTDISSVSG